MATVALAIDGLNIVQAAAQVGKRVDFAALLRFVSDNGRHDVLFKNFYIGPPANESPAKDGASPADWYGALRCEIEKMGYAWTCCESPSSRPGRVKSNVDIAIAVDLVTWAIPGRVDMIYLAGGDGDYLIAVHRARQMGAKLCLLGITASGHVSRSLLGEVPPADFDDLDKRGALRPL